ncbi:MAG: hypothetical protein JSR85_00075 [Proteobacteria bacterium]|nr:hypothetical protein [Pseudomonadota bacterium]
MTIKNLFHAYALLVCFVAAIILLITLALSFGAITDYLFPEIKHASTVRSFESNDKYINAKEREANPNDKETPTLRQLPAAQVDQKRTADKANFLQDTKDKAVEELMRYLHWIVIAAGFFFLHWKLYKRNVVDTKDLK